MYQCPVHPAVRIAGKVKVKFSLYRPWRPLGLLEVKAPTFIRHSRIACTGRNLKHVPFDYNVA
jgi:hypothetical protein